MAGFNTAYWNERLSREIPATKLLKLVIEEINQQRIMVTAPLAPNQNGHGTGFAGSIYTIGITTGWTYLNAWAQELALDVKVVALDASIHYRQPIEGAISATNVTDISEHASRWPELFADKQKHRERLSVQIGDPTNPSAANLDIMFHISFS